MAEIRLSGINKVYPGGTHAVHDVDLHIADGEFMIMVGPSGCAKSTILRMIAGLEVPTGGTIQIGGRVVNDVAPKDRDIAMVFQSYALYPHMTVRENMAFGLRLRRMPQGDIDQRVAEAARILGLEHLLDRLPKAMSGGQRQRVAMGRAIVREPQAFLMDEPLSNLDAKLRVQMRTEIAKLHQRLCTTTVYVTHDQVEALTLGQRICILRKGVVQQVDTPFQVYTNPANVFVGGFIGSPGMNFMNGHLVLHEGLLYLRLGDHHLPLPTSVTSRLLASTDLHGRGVVVGIRPEHLDLTAEGDPAALPVHVELTEAMGAEVYAYFTAGVATPDLSALSDTQATAETFVARLAAGTDAPTGSRIWLQPDLDEVHLFDPQTMLTMLAPADEASVRARQSGAAIELASTVPGSQGPVAAPPSATLVQPVQPVIHLHQTFLRPDTAPAAAVQSGDAAAIASVFDSQVASPVALEPLMPAAAAAGPHGLRPAAQHAGPAAAAPARPTFAGSMLGEPSQPQLLAGSREAPAPAPGVPEATTGSAPTPAPAYGFAPRYIGAAPEPGPAGHRSHADPDRQRGAERTPALQATAGGLDDAVGRLDVARAAQRDSAGFRDALARIRLEGTSGARPGAAGSGLLPPRTTSAEPRQPWQTRQTRRSTSPGFRAPDLRAPRNSTEN